MSNPPVTLLPTRTDVDRRYVPPAHAEILTSPMRPEAGDPAAF
jgi:hypothetical protein